MGLTRANTLKEALNNGLANPNKNLSWPCRPFQFSQRLSVAGVNAKLESTHPRDISSKLVLASASLATGGQQYSEWTGAGRIDGLISLKARASGRSPGRDATTVVPCGSPFVTRPSTYFRRTLCTTSSRRAYGNSTIQPPSLNHSSFRCSGEA